MTAPASLWHHRGFLFLWGGQSVSEVGSAVTAIGLPLVAVTTLNVSAFEVALQAGALVDRWRRKRVLLVRADLLRAAMLVTSVLTVFFDVAHQSFLPALVPREQLNEGNAKPTATGEIGRVAGPGVGGALAVLWLLASPLRSARDLSDLPDGPGVARERGRWAHPSTSSALRARSITRRRSRPSRTARSRPAVTPRRARRS